MKKYLITMEIILGFTCNLFLGMESTIKQKIEERSIDSNLLMGMESRFIEENTSKQQEIIEEIISKEKKKIFDYIFQKAFNKVLDKLIQETKEEKIKKALSLNENK